MSANFQFLDFTFRDGYIARMRYWRGGSRGAVLYLHGIQSHGLWFEQSAERLAREGFSVLLPDRRGSGLNENNRGHVDSFGTWIRDVDELVDWLGKATGREKIHLVGVSWGGKLALASTMRRLERFKSLTMIAPGLFPKVDVSGWEKFRILNRTAIGSRAPIPIPLNQPELFTENAEKQEFIRNDSLRLQYVTARFLFESRRMDFFIQRNDLRLPVRVKLFLAEKERIIDNHKTICFFRGLRGTHCKEVSMYSGASHTLEFELNPEPFVNDLTKWMVSCDTK
jgi:alpha-beta hydrolase superfamily lysophospholipase